VPDFMNYRKSISQELISTKNRVRNFIDNNHMGEDGRYKEIILTEKIRQLLPKTVSVGTGFVMCEDNNITSQIDIIIYRNDLPLFFQIDNFIIASKESVLGIIEVKTNLDSSKVNRTIEKAHLNGKLIGNQIFNGIFSYENGFSFNNNELNRTLSHSLENYAGYINNIVFGKDYFMKLWEQGKVSQYNELAYYRFYKIDDLSFGYFLSNLVEDVNRQYNKSILPRSFKQSLYPIENSKEVHEVFNLVVKYNNHNGEQ